MPEAKRRISLEEDFFNKNIDDRLYGFLQCLATFHPVEKKLYLAEENYMANRTLIRDLCGWSTQKTLKRNIDRLIDVGLLKEGKIEINEEEVNCFFFPYDKDLNYELIKKDMLQYLVNTRNKHAIQIYIYLVNKYKWKNNYRFTYEELATALGYSVNSDSVIEVIKDVLESFKREGVLNYRAVYEPKVVKGVEIQIQKRELLFVAQSVKELPKI